jgi:hypothetical protein
MKELEDWAQARAQALGHDMSRWHNHGSPYFWREVTCAKCDSSIVYTASEGSLAGAALSDKCDHGAALRREAAAGRPIKRV